MAEAATNVAEKKDSFDLTEEILKLLDKIKEETIATALQQLGVPDCQLLDKAGKMKKFEKHTVYAFGVGRLLKVLKERDFKELEENLLRYSNLELDQMYAIILLLHFR
jgi:hypothetical protein